MKKIIELNVCEYCEKEIDDGLDICDTCLRILTDAGEEAFKRYKRHTKVFDENINILMALLERAKDENIKHTFGTEGLRIKKELLEKYKEEV